MAGFICVTPKSISVDFRIYTVQVNKVVLVMFNGTLVMTYNTPPLAAGFILRIERNHADQFKRVIRELRARHKAHRTLKAVDEKRLHDEAYRMVAKSILQEMNTLITGEE